MAKTRRYASEDNELRRWREGLDAALRKGPGRPAALRAPGRHRGLKVFTLILGMFVLAAGAGAAYFYQQLNGRIGRAKVTTRVASGGIFNVLLIGADTRSATQSAEDVKRFGRVEGKRADTIILMQAVPGERRASLIHFPRDLWVPIAGRGTAKINSSYEYGPQTVIDTVQALTGVSINNYIEVNLQGFRNIVDAINGIDVCIDRPMRDPVLQFKLSAGSHHLNGNEALTFVRSRYSDPDGDFGRIRRQQQFLRAVVSKVGTKRVLLNPVRLNELATAFADNVTTDQTLSVTKMLSLARNIHSIGPEALRTYTVPGDVGRAGGQSVVFMDTERAKVLFQALRDGVDPAKALAPAPVQIALEDASGRGLGTQVAGGLREQGFIVNSIDTAPKTQTRTDVVTPRSQANDARRLLAVLPNPRLLYAGTSIKLVIGSSFTSLVRPAQGEAPSPTGPCANFNPGQS